MGFSDGVINDDTGSNATAMSHVDSHFMKLALAEAKKAGTRGEVPIGALVVRSLEDDRKGEMSDVTKTGFFQILSAGSNRVEERRDASAHAEMLAMRKAATSNDDASWRLLNTTLYTTVEPCAMCLAAAQAFRVGRIVYGAPDLRLGAIDTYVNLLQYPHPFHNIDEVVRGVHQEESAALLRSFFQRQREKKKKQGAQSGAKGKRRLWFLRRPSRSG